LRDLAVLVDQVGDAARVFILGRIGGAVREADLSFGVAQQREGEVELFGETLVRFLLVEAGAEDEGVLRGVLLDEVPEPGTFARSAGCVGLWIKPEHDLLAAQIGKPDAIALMIEDVEVRSVVAWLEHLSLPPKYGLQDSFERHADIVRP
jgi:hypothetical protein